MTAIQPLHLQLYEEMARRIQSGAWETGDRVPSEKSLIAEFGTSRGPVRQALAALRAEGVITGGRGAPPRVQRAVPSQSFGTFLSFTEWAKRTGFVPGQQVVEVAKRPASEHVARELNVTPEDTIVEVVRLRTLDGEPALFERTHFAYPVGVHILSASFDDGSIYQTLAQHGIVPARARHVIDAVAAHPLDAEWLRVSPGFPLLRARRVSTTEDGTVIEYADDRHLPSMTTFAIENTAAHRTQFTRESAGGPQPPVSPA
ncbi:GntR family transcriptional regulator [Leucobacter komagatae]|uniref:GntR family transcriptional regulator n=1 Tax=Leucobacter komagatae TaxID=55969 RepID=A0A0D0INP2_9MICO|nr:GntR family transcriptional regulator [Leucobacter komagatae]KIP52697.1 GntR family transcriptional regulator [Leucobacter komagatae]